jgi:hypothetical protein
MRPKGRQFLAQSVRAGWKPRHIESACKGAARSNAFRVLRSAFFLARFDELTGPNEAERPPVFSPVRIREGGEADYRPWCFAISRSLSRRKRAAL